MGVNFSPFEIGRRALNASQLGLNVTGHNIANVNTPGYTRQSVQQSPTPADIGGSRLSGVGVTIDGVRSFRDRFVESRLQTETAINGRLTARRDALAPVDAAFNETQGGGINSAMNGFFGAFRDLEAHPNSLPLRAAVVEKAAALGSSFQTTRARLVTVSQDAGGAISETVTQANALSTQIAALNARVRVAEQTGVNSSELRDQRGELVKQFTELTGARAAENSDGTITLTLADGRPLVLGDTANPLVVSLAQNGALPAITLDGSPASIADGRLRGLLDASGDINNQITALDDLAASIAARVNALHTSGTDQSGTPGVNFFAVPSDGSPVTAANLTINPAVRNDPRLVVASPLQPAAASGAATVAGSIADLMTEKSSQAGGRSGSFSSIYASIVADAGRGVRDAEDALATQGVILAQVTAQRDSASGVSLDEEAINLLQYQKAYEAAARFLRVADEMTQTILSLGT